MSFSELHSQSYFSFLCASSSPEDLVIMAKEKGLSAIALTDESGLYGVIPFYKKCIELEIKPIIGSILLLENNDKILVICKNQSAYESLCSIISASRKSQEKGISKTTYEMLLELNDNFFVLIGFKSTVLHDLLVKNKVDQADQLVSSYLKHIDKQDLYFELNHHKEKEDRKHCDLIYEYASSRQIECIASNGVHYAKREDAKLQDVLLCIKNKVNLRESHSLRFANHERFIKSFEEMNDLFKKYPRVLNNTQKISESCSLNLDFSKYRFPDFPVPPSYKVDSYLQKLCYEAIPRKYRVSFENNTIDRGEVNKRLEVELKVIKNKSLCGYFLLVWDIVQYSLGKNIPAQGRGSAANSLVAYLLDITPVCPIKHNLFFGRFLNESSDAIPDIDIDFASYPNGNELDREDIIQYVYKKYGYDHVAMVCTFVTFRARSAIKEVGKVLEFPDHVLSKMAKTCGTYNSKVSFDDFSKLEEFSKLLQSKTWIVFQNMVHAIMNIPRHPSIHVGGMLISSIPIHRVVPLEPARMNNRVVCQWDKDMVEEAGLIKVDILGLRMLSVLRDVKNQIKKSTNRVIDYRDIEEDDPRVYDIMGKADTVGLFQVESRAQMQSLPRTKPRNFHELAIQVAIIRPGPLQGGMVNPYIRRRQKEEVVEYDHPSLEPILKDTLGVILFQEQILQVAIEIADFSEGEADVLRRNMSKKRSKELMAQLKSVFFERALKNGLSFDAIDSIYKALEGFALYGFCKSHALAFAKITYVSAWYKKYYPAEFLASILNHHPMGFYSNEVIIQDAKHHGIEIIPPSVNKSEIYCFGAANKIFIGLNLIKGLSISACEKIYSIRSEKIFEGLYDFIDRTDMDHKKIEYMILAGAFDCFKQARRELLWSLWAYKKRSLQKSWIQVKEKEPDLPSESDWSKLQNEFSSIGFSASTHPLKLVRDSLVKTGVVPSTRLKTVRNGHILKVAGMSVCRQRPPTAKGFAFLTLEDEFGMMNIILPPLIYEQYRIIFRRSNFIIAEGRRVSKDGVINIKANRLLDLEIGQ
ncbi:MAG: DNA polymerase III subunit alpha [Candidatus Cloacimonetes bacterium]|nr:DNA polymerase III subunit alpha [Candidatus Cloacimonadota bacterium]